MSSSPATPVQRVLGLGLLMGVLALMPGATACARVHLTQDEALALAFPEAVVERENVFLTEKERQQAAALADAQVKRKLVPVYRAWLDAKWVGSAYFDTHLVRTLPETLMVVVDPAGRVQRIEVLSFREPPEYLPREPWYNQFLGQELDQTLKLKRSIRPVTGATLTARATLEAVRRLLALHRVIEQRETEPPVREVQTGESP